MPTSIEDLARHIRSRQTAYDRALQSELAGLERRFGSPMLRQAMLLASEAETREALSVSGQRQRLTARKKAERAAQNLFRTTRER